MQVQPMIRKIDVVEKLADGIIVLKVVTRLPWPLTDRIMFNIAYVHINEQTHEIVWMSSGRNNDEFVSRYLTEED